MVSDFFMFFFFFNFVNVLIQFCLHFHEKSDFLRIKSAEWKKKSKLRYFALGEKKQSRTNLYDRVHSMDFAIFSESRKIEEERKVEWGRVRSVKKV